MNIWNKVKQFNSLVGSPSCDTPTLPKLNETKYFLTLVKSAIERLNILSSGDSTSQRGLRIKLLAEEMGEYLEAEIQNDLVEISDALTDLHYIASGTEAVYGLPGEEIFNHVHDTNMAKVWEDGKVHYREDGKVLKPDNWTAPDIKKILSAAGMVA